MIKECLCRQCNRSFLGGPRAYYCSICRIERQRQADREYKSKARQGLTRKLGSIDTCERCGNKYVINGSLQRFCLDCKPVHTLEYDRETSLPFYHENKNVINPVRNERRRLGMRNCDWCGKEHNVSIGGTTTCSPECKRLLKNKKWNERDKRIRLEEKDRSK